VDPLLGGFEGAALALGTDAALGSAGSSRRIVTLIERAALV
jgi:hypothetical protein